MYREISATLGVICPLITCASFYYCKSSIKPSLSNKPPSLISHPYAGKENLKTPPVSFKPPFPYPFLFFTNEWYTVLINHDFKTSFGLILNDSFTCCRKFGFTFNPRLKWPPISCTWACLLCILVFLWRTDKAIFAKSNKPHTRALGSLKLPLKRVWNR